jgi:hypothetical protein
VAHKLLYVLWSRKHCTGCLTWILCNPNKTLLLYIYIYIYIFKFSMALLFVWSPSLLITAYDMKLFHDVHAIIIHRFIQNLHYIFYSVTWIPCFNNTLSTFVDRLIYFDGSFAMQAVWDIRFSRLTVCRWQLSGVLCISWPKFQMCLPPPSSGRCVPQRWRQQALHLNYVRRNKTFRHL